ncbi:MAG: hypothetical protein KAU62_01300 [Candidatus Heimdallarchaeota archaeon]|nr:hypothetical protein [Candidatus Heimdallarchaeota archaeon]MCK4609770.1 hypothetical protein [Candidatus Heimdallarchaeota archaeon]
MSSKIRLLDKQSMWPSVIAIFAMSFLAQIPHFYYLHDILEFNNWEYLPLLIAFPIFGAIGLSAVSLLITESLMNKVRDTKERKLYRYLIRGSLISIGLYLFIQIFVVFFGFEAIAAIRNILPPEVIDSVTFKEIFGMSIILIIGLFVNPPAQLKVRRRK